MRGTPKHGIYSVHSDHLRHLRTLYVYLWDKRDSQASIRIRVGNVEADEVECCAAAPKCCRQAFLIRQHLQRAHPQQVGQCCCITGHTSAVSMYIVAAAGSADSGVQHAILSTVVHR